MATVMERAFRERKTARRFFTVSADKLESALTDKNKGTIKAHFTSLTDRYEQLSIVDNKILNLWLDIDDRDEEAYEADLDSMEVYNDRWYALQEKYKEYMEDCDICEGTKGSNTIIKKKTSAVSVCSDQLPSRHYRLPQLHLPKFNGEVKQWLVFWAQFNKIYLDDNIDNDDKFQYLLQCMEEGSSAQELVKSFPPTGDNYENVVKQLQARFARKDILIEHYVRELIQLVVAQTKSGTRMATRHLYDKLMTQILTLESMGITQNKYAAFLYPLVESALPEETLRAWNRSPHRCFFSDCLDSTTDMKEPNHLSKLLEFIKREVESEESIQLSRSGFSSIESKPTAPTASFLAETVKRENKQKMNSPETKELKGFSCVWCDKAHPSSECNNAKKMTLEERKQHLKEKRACYRCLNVGHAYFRCKKFVKCIVCARGHHPIMCPELEKSTYPGKEDDKPVVLKQAIKSSTVLLQTVKLNIVNNGKAVQVRALLDSGAQRSFIKSDVIDLLQIEPDGEEKLRHNLFGGVVTKLESHRVFVLHCQSLDGSYNFHLDALENKVICDDLPKVGPGELRSKLKAKGITLSDCVNDSSVISLLIGSNVLGSLYTGRSVHVSGNLIAVETKLGWTVLGPTIGMYTCFPNSNINKISFDVNDLWNLETLGIKDADCIKTIRKREEKVEQYFNETIHVNDEGRYEVRLPWKETGDILSTNRDVAYRRLESTSRKLEKLNLLADYENIFNEWLDSGIIEEVANDNTEQGHYLPHHVVIRESSLTTRLRPVFDASALTKEGVSLNSCLEKGSNLISLIPPLLINFRKGAIGITADIKKAFLQISIQPKDRDFLKFLWWKDLTKKNKILKVFRHRRVVFGVSSSPFLLAATINHHLQKLEGDTVEKLKQSFYVDNCVVSVNNKEDMKKFIMEAKDVMNKGKFELRCWMTGPELSDNQEQTTSVLGLTWDPTRDEMWCNATFLSHDSQKLTRRSLLSMAQSIFDPIGFLCPTTLVPKLLIQKCWESNLAWDSELPEDIEKIASQWLQHIQAIKECRIPRRLSHSLLERTDCRKTLHVFSDACQSSYAGCVFLRTECDGIVTVQLVLAKARVAPIKTVTLPRLELIAALMATRLASEAKASLKLDCKEYFWSDSSIVIAWINRMNGLNVFVFNRVKEIISRSNISDWHHVPGDINPADLPSRGVNATQLLKSRWWEGPAWLREPPGTWPCSTITPDEVEVNKEMKKSCLIFQDNVFSDKLTYFSKYSKIVRTVGWCLRFINNCRKNTKRRNVLGGDEFIEAERVLCLLIQKENFKNLEALRRSTKLDLFYDKDGLIRVKTRLTLSDYPINFIAPILLPKDNIFVQRLVEQEHARLHAGTQTLITTLRENWWIIAVRGLVKKVVARCIKCKRYKARACTVPPAPLPAGRVQCGDPFDIIGTDLAGPLYLKNNEKRWIVLFTCATYRALHIELDDSLSTEDFMLCLRRFIARRGRVKTIYCDNGTNFRGTSNLLDAIDWSEIADKTSTEKIEWRFLPPQAPWWGGWYERMVRSIKDLLRRTLGKAALLEKELLTILYEVEALINSRPLTYIFDSTENLKPLTPSMFLQANCSDSTDLEHIDSKVLSIRYRYIKQVCDDIKQRFRKEYLSMLTQKNATPGHGLKVGDIVVVGVDGVKRVLWPLGIVTEIFAGVDSECRVAKVKLAHGERIRALQRLYPLELSSETSFPVPQTFTTKHADEDSTSNMVGPPPLDKPSDTRTTRTGRPIKVPQRLDL